VAYVPRVADAHRRLSGLAGGFFFFLHKNNNLTHCKAVLED
jgi:hypothetical protein